MRNIEIKAQCAEFGPIEQLLNDMGAGLAGSFDQSDTYFRAPHGRLKLRQVGPDEGQLIQYRRDDVAGPKPSEYQIAHTSDPAAMREMLADLLGVWLQVTKTRQIWLWENVRIHLDEVADLGRYIELEAVTEEQGVVESTARVEHLMQALGIQPGDLVPVSYSDLLAGSSTPS
jgi:predicted adenylyl cyclase CyaB